MTIKAHVIERYGPNATGSPHSKDVSYIGKPGERCADCISWRKTGEKFVGGEGMCSRDKEETAGLGLCANFQGKKGDKP